jgi:hypothetical protein
VALAGIELNFVEFKSGGLHEKDAVATWNHLSYVSRQRKLKENHVEMAGCRTFRMHTYFYPAFLQAKSYGRYPNISLT